MEIPSYNSFILKLTASYAEEQLSPRRLTELALEDATNLKTLNAFVRLTPEKALLQAEDSLKRYQSKKPKGILDGVTIAIKDNFCTEGIPTTCGSK